MAVQKRSHLWWGSLAVLMLYGAGGNGLEFRPIAMAEETTPSSTPIKGNDIDLQVEKALDTTIKDFDLTNKTLEVALDELARVAGVSIQTEWKALQDEEYAKEFTPQSLAPKLKLHNHSVRRVLEILTRSQGNGVGFTIYNGSVVISTKEVVNSPKYQIVRLYDIHNLLHQGEPAGDLTKNTKPTTTPITPEETEKNIDLVADYCDLIKATVAPATWTDNGGSIGSIREINGLLCINQTAEIHQQIKTLLHTLESRPHPVKLSAGIYWVQAGDYANVKAFLNSGKEGLQLIVPDNKIDQILETLQHKENITLSAPLLSVVNRGELQISDTKDEVYIANYTAVSANKLDPPSFLPVKEHVETGSQLTCKVSATEDYTQAIIALDLKYKQLIKMEETVVNNSNGFPMGTIKTPTTNEKRLTTTVRIPTRKTEIIGGPKITMLIPEGDDGKPTPHEGYLVLLIKPDVSAGEE